MRRLPPNQRLLALLSVLLVAGFLTVAIAGYLVSLNSIRTNVADHSLPLTSDNIYSEIQKDLLRPVFISSLMAHDTFLRDWVLDGERQSDQIVRYLREVKERYGTISSFLVSARTHRYYYGEGVLKTVREDEPRDRWFFRVAAMHEPYETNVDFDMANRDSMTIFINYRVLDYHGNFIGTTGVGLALDTVSRIIDSYQARFHRDIYFVDRDGDIVMAGKSLKKARGSIRALPGIAGIAQQILKPGSAPTRLEYALGDAQILVNSRYIPELGWYLIVEQDVSEAVQPVRHVFFLNLAISLAVTVLVLAITLVAVNRYQRRLEQTAATDALTGLLNRQAAELILQQAIAEFDRNRRPLSAILFDIDLFKRINDSFGHLAGDEVIRSVARLAREVVRGSDVVARWGGEEFMVLLKDCPVDQAAAIAEKLREAVARENFDLPVAGTRVTVSLGVAQYQEGETQEQLFARADALLYRAKSAGRDRCEAESLEPLAPSP